MPDKIKILPQSIANKIAAGEVVSRPESVVKELMENSLDANSTKITLIIRDAGKTLIQVIDNGGGMIEEDAKLCFERHSTSKISTFEDLENIITLGFRGEALASICSVSQIEMKTKTKDDEVGTLIRIDGGEFKEISKINCDTGTSLSVKNLFFNTPGRRNFLKSNQTEFRHIYETFIKLAISHPQVEFEFINHDELIFELKPADLYNRIRDLFTQRFAESLITVKDETSIIKINGFISKPDFTKKSKQDQYFFLNNRFFLSKSLNYAVYSGYDDLIEKGDYPSFFIFIDIDPHKVDVNVHPSKLEVKFEEEGAVFAFIKNAVRNALKKADLTFEIGFDNRIGYDRDSETLSSIKSTEIKSDSDSPDSFTPKVTFKTGITTGKIHSIFEATKPVKEEEKEEPESGQQNTLEHRKQEESEKFNVWQFQNKYIMCQTETGLMIIDQHAANERILYEKALLWLESHSSISQQLLIPVNIKLSKIDYQLAEMLRDEFQNLGFNINFLKDDSIEITGIPADVRIGDENKIFQELLDQYKEYELKLNLDKRDNLAKSFACKSAIKTGDRLTQQEMTGLIDNLFGTKMPYVCPHGRPTVIRITTEELDKRFSRT